MSSASSSAVALQRASYDQLALLLGLYPAEALKTAWPEKTKAASVARAAGNREFNKITQFLRQYIGCCKQHVYIFEHQCRDLKMT